MVGDALDKLNCLAFGNEEKKRKEEVVRRETKTLRLFGRQDDAQNGHFRLDAGNYRFSIKRVEKSRGSADFLLVFKGKDGHILKRERHGAIGKIYHKSHKQQFTVSAEDAPVSLEFSFEAHVETFMFRSSEEEEELLFNVKLEWLAPGAASTRAGLTLSMEQPGLHSYSIPKRILETVLANVPKRNVKEMPNSRIFAAINGPKQEGKKESYKDFMFGKSISTYPYSEVKKQREGDPICDSFCYCQFENRVVMSIADGCSWGEKPKQASVTASEIFVSDLSATNWKTLREAAIAMLTAFEHAHAKIIEGRTAEDIWDVGTTTLAGGMLFETDTKGEWLFLCLSVGDCKVFHWSFESEEVTDVTAGNRKNLTDPRDPGGRVGPFLAAGLPDWRNLDFYSVMCREGDILFAVSDGVHDNLDPQELGILPNELGMKQFPNWKEAEQKDPQETDRVKTEYRTALLQRLFSDTRENRRSKRLMPEDITESLLKHCQEVTDKSRSFMEQNPGKKLPLDYSQYPGKLDHTTCVSFRVGNAAHSETV